jgi:hypothetical protein
METNLKRYELHTELGGSLRVDPVNGVIHGVALITSGVQARGHDLEVDRKTLEQIHECATKLGTVPVKWNHRTGADAVNGYLDNFRIEGTKLLGDWHLLKSHDRFDQAIELASRMPKNVGLSAAFMGEDEKRGGRTLARCSELISVDLVAQPAANPDGLFEAKLDGKQPASVDSKNKNTMANENPTGAAPEPTLADVLAGIQKLTEAHTALTSRIDALEGAAGNEAEQGLTMEDLLAMNPDQLEAALDEAVNSGEITGEQAGQIWATCAANAGADDSEGQEEGGEGAGAPAGELAGASAGGDTALSALQKQVKYLSARIAGADEAKEEVEIAHYFEQVEHALSAQKGRIVELEAENKNLSVQCDALRKAIRTGTRPVSFSAEGAAMNNGGKLHEFENKVEAHVKAGKSRGEAIMLSHKEDPELHRDYLRALSEQANG